MTVDVAIQYYIYTRTRVSTNGTAASRLQGLDAAVLGFAYYWATTGHLICPFQPTEVGAGREANDGFGSHGAQREHEGVFNFGRHGE